MKELGKVTNWHEFGIALDMPGEVLNSIRSSNPNGDVGEWKSAMFQRWLDRTPTASWNDIIRALNELGYHTLAEELTSKYIKPPHGQLSAVGETNIIIYLQSNRYRNLIFFQHHDYKMKLVLIKEYF